MGLRWLVNAYSSHSIHGVKRGGGSLSPQSQGGRDPHHMQGCHTQSLEISLRKPVVLTSSIPSNIQLKIKLFFFSSNLCLTQRLI